MYFLPFNPWKPQGDTYPSKAWKKRLLILSKLKQNNNNKYKSESEKVFKKLQFYKHQWSQGKSVNELVKMYT